MIVNVYISIIYLIINSIKLNCMARANIINLAKALNRKETD